MMSRYKKVAVIFLFLCTVVLVMHNELIKQYNLKSSLLRQGRSLLLNSDFRESLSLTKRLIGSHWNDVINRRSIWGKSDSTNANSSMVDRSFEHWVQYNPRTLAIFVFSAVASNTSLWRGFKQDLKLNAWEGRKSRHSLIKCCFIWNNNKTTYYLNPNKTYYQKIKMGLSALQVHCPIRGNVRDVVGVSLQFRRSRCPNQRELYIKPVQTMKPPPGSLAICGKIFYGNIDPKLVIDWVEYYRELKVNKILLYKYNLTKKAEAVIDYYASTGFIQTGRFDFPWKTGKRDVGTKNPEAWTDEQVVVYDCFERLKGYTYMTIVDLDEFIYPRKHDSLISMVDYLRGRNSTAAGFTFKSHLFIKDWGKIEENNGSDIVQYFNRTSAVFTREKNLIMPNRIIEGTIHTHKFEPLEGYHRVNVSSSIAILNHYRNCYSNFLYRCTHAKRHKDKSILRFVEKIKTRTLPLAKKFT